MNGPGRPLLFRGIAAPEPRRFRRLRRKIEIACSCLVLALLAHAFVAWSYVTP